MRNGAQHELGLQASLAACWEFFIIVVEIKSGVLFLYTVEALEVTFVVVH